MAKLKIWCDEASVAHWESNQESDWSNAVQRLSNSGRLSFVQHPSPQQSAGQISIT